MAFQLGAHLIIMQKFCNVNLYKEELCLYRTYVNFEIFFTFSNPWSYFNRFFCKSLQVLDGVASCIQLYCANFSAKKTTLQEIGLDVVLHTKMPQALSLIHI